MASKFGRGFIVNLMLLNRHFSQAPEQAFYGAADHLDEIRLPEQFQGTPVETILEQLRKRVIWHSPGMMDKEDAAEVIQILNRMAIAIDRELGIQDAEFGQFG